MKETLSEFFEVACIAAVAIAAFIGTKALYLYIIGLIA